MAVGKFAVQNRALLSILLGLVSTLIGLAAHPGSAQAATQIDQLLQGSDVDSIIDKLHHAGIEVGAVDTTSLPPGISETVAKAAQAIHAIEKFEYQQGSNIASSRDLTQTLTVVGDVMKAGSSLHEHIRVTTPDGSLVLADIDTTVTTVDGQPSQVSDTQGGIKFRLFDMLKGKSVAESNAIQDYLDKATTSVTEASQGVFQRIKALFQSKTKDFGQMVAQAVAQKPDGHYRVTISAGGVQVEQA